MSKKKGTTSLVFTGVVHDVTSEANLANVVHDPALQDDTIDWLRSFSPGFNSEEVIYCLTIWQTTSRSSANIYI